MTTRLDNLVQECKTLLDAGGCEVAHYQDALALTEHKPGRRVVWISDRGTIGPPGRIGGYLADNGKMVTCCAQRGAEVTVFAYAENLAIAEQLLDNVIVAISQTLENVSWSEYALLTQEDESKRVGHVNRVECAMLRFTLPLPVPDYITALPTVDYISTVGDELTIIEGADEQGTFDPEQTEPYPDDGGDPDP